MTQIRVAEWKSIPAGARICGLVLGKLKRTADSPLGALQELCHCASVVAGLRLKAVVRSGQFNKWLGYSGVGIVKPVKCSVNIYVSGQATDSTNLMRIALLSEALGISSSCYLLYDVKSDEELKRGKQYPRKPFHQIRDSDVPDLKPIAIILGSRRIVVQSWNECLPEYVKYVKTSVPFGEQLAPPVPVGYERFDARACLRAICALVESSGLDKYSVCLEFATRETGALLVSEAKESCPSNENDRAETVTVATDCKDAIPRDPKVLSKQHFRQFAPSVVVW